MLVLMGILYRVVLFCFYLHSNLFPDSGSFIDLGNKMLTLSLRGYSGERSPGYPLLYFLAFGSTRLTVILQFGIGVITSVYWYKTLLNLNFSIKNSFWITLFLESFLHVFLYESSFLIETPVLFLISVVFYILSNNYFEKKSWKLEIWMSVLLGYLVLMKPFFAYIPFLIYFFAVIYKFKFVNIVNRKMILFIFPLMAYFGWSYVNKINTGYFVSTSFLGLNIAQNCVYFAEKGPPQYKWLSEPYAKHRDIYINENKDVAMSIWEAYGSGEYDYKEFTFPQLSHEMGKYAKETIVNNPKDYFYQVITKSWFDFWLVFGKKEFMPFRVDFFDSIMNFVWAIQSLLLLFFKFSFLLLVPFYVVKFLWNRKISMELIIVTVVFTTSLLQGLVTYGTNAKYSFPFEYLMIIVVLLFLKNNVTLPRFLSTFLQ
jgi:4-amino-4-deoxy-L-arabinose transferase-like glycosyltransferase